MSSCPPTASWQRLPAPTRFQPGEGFPSYPVEAGQCRRGTGWRLAIVELEALPLSHPFCGRLQSGCPTGGGITISVGLDREPECELAPGLRQGGPVQGPRPNERLKLIYPVRGISDASYSGWSRAGGPVLAHRILICRAQESSVPIQNHDRDRHPFSSGVRVSSLGGARGARGPAWAMCAWSELCVVVSCTEDIARRAALPRSGVAI